MITVVGRNFGLSKVMIMNQYLEHGYRKVKFSSSQLPIVCKNFFFLYIFNIQLNALKREIDMQTNNQADRQKY